LADLVNRIISLISFKLKLKAMKKVFLMMALFAGILMSFASCGGGESEAGGDADTSHTHGEGEEHSH
jgi:hypothetical protein